MLLAALTLSLSATDYLSEGGDPGRTGWIRDEKVFSRANVKDTRLLWKIKLDSQPRQMHTVRAHILDATNRRVFDGTTALSAAQFLNGAADYLLDLPLAPLSPGAHLLTIEASAGKPTASRQVRFLVTR